VSIITNFKSIRQKLERQEQKAEFEAKNPRPDNTVVWTPEWGYGVPTPLKSMAHPEWPYIGTPHEWRKFKI
jgi:hypothetical protein